MNFILLIVTVFFLVINAKVHYKNPNFDESFGFSKSDICNVQTFERDFYFEINDSYKTKPIRAEENSQILSCFRFNNNLFQIFIAKGRKFVVYKNGLQRRYLVPFGFKFLIFDNLTNKMYMIINNQILEIDFADVDKHYALNDTLQYFPYKQLFSNINSNIFGTKIYNNTIYFLNPYKNQDKERENYSSLLYIVDKYTMNILPTNKTKLDFVITENVEGAKFLPIINSNDNPHMIILYLLDAILVIGLIFLYRCLQIKLEHLKKKYGIEMKDFTKPLLIKKMEDNLSI